MFVEALNTVGTALNAYEVGKKSVPLLGKIVRLIRDRQLNIVICGAGGTGKSTLAKLLSGEFDREDILQPYQASLRIENRTLRSDTPSSIVVLPGQLKEWNDSLKQMANNKVNLVINTVSYGYHSINQIDYQTLSFYRTGTPIKTLMNAYTDSQRSLEMEYLKYIIPYLSLAGNAQIAMMTLVTKQDLWWLARNEVNSYYRSGEYDRLVTEVQNNLGRINFIHEYVSASLITENFIDANGTMLVPVAEGYDQKIQLINFDRVIQFIENTLDLNIWRYQI
jgi:energy-coupling factor transporter ATP-binding protein EcfA2